MTTSEAFKALYDTVKKLRSPEGCIWDREQTPATLRKALVEETYECLEAINENDPAHIAEELGDLYLVVTMIAYIYEQENKFSVTDTLAGINEKLIRRHPHVFGDVKVKDTAEILDNWANIKMQEGRKPKDSILDNVSSGIPPMDRAYALQKKAAKAGFDWPDVNGVIDKINEEMEEVLAASCGIAMNNEEVSLQDAIQEVIQDAIQEVLVEQDTLVEQEVLVEQELGDLLFSVVNLCRFLKIDPSVALHRTNSKFIERFKYVEKKMKETNQEMKKENLDTMETFWQEAKNK